MLILPQDLVFEIFARLPGKQLGRCKCVCKSWRSIIRSPPFLEVYRSRHLRRILTWAEEIDRNAVQRLDFFYSDLQEPAEEFSYLRQLTTVRHLRVTNIVNGLVCFWESNDNLTIYNIFTGETVRVLYLAYYHEQGWNLHLGYDPESRVYKLLRFKFLLCNQALRVKIMTLGPSGFRSKWRNLNLYSPGIGELLPMNKGLAGQTTTVLGSGFYQNRVFGGGDGLVWFLGEEGVLFFDLNKEKFQWIRISFDFSWAIRSLSHHHPILAHSMERPALCFLPSCEEDHPNDVWLFVFNNMEYSRWSEHHVLLPQKLNEVSGLIRETGNHPTGEILLMNAEMKNQDCCRPIYSYNHSTNKFVRFLLKERLDMQLWTLGVHLHLVGGQLGVQC